MKNFLPILLVAAFALTACPENSQTPGDRETDTATTSTATIYGSSDNRTNETSPSNVGAGTGGTVQTSPSHYQTGIPECENYLTKYEACINQAPQDRRQAMKALFDRQLEQWKKAAQTENRADVAESCLEAMDEARQSMAEFRCSW